MTNGQRLVWLATAIDKSENATAMRKLLHEQNADEAKKFESLTIMNFLENLTFGEVFDAMIEKEKE